MQNSQCRMRVISGWSCRWPNVAQQLGLTIKGRWVRCPNDQAHWARLWLKKNKLKCFRCGARPLSNIDLVMNVLHTDVNGAIKWLAARFDVPRVGRRITTNLRGLTRRLYVDYPARPRPPRLEPNVSTLRRAAAWPSLTHAARLLAPVLLEIIPKSTLTITTTQEELRRLAGISNRGTAKNALLQLERIGLAATAREAADREPRSGRFTTALRLRLTWGSAAFQAWLATGGSATRYRCSKLNTVKPANGHEIEHGARGAKRT